MKHPIARITIVFEYKIDPNDYEKGITLNEMLEQDLQNFRGDPQLIIDNMFDLKIIGELKR